VNPFAYPVNYTLSSLQGTFQTGTGSLTPGMNNILVGFDDGINFDLFIDVIITLTDPVTGNTLCIQDLGIPLTPSQTTACPPDIHLNSITCIGKDIAGHGIYAVNFDLGNAMPNASISVSCLQGIVSLITPNTTGASPGAVINVNCQVVDYMAQGVLCFAVQLTDLNGGAFCYTDFNTDNSLCLPFVPCANPKDPSPPAVKNNFTIHENANNLTYISIEPNPSAGNALLKIKCTEDFHGYTFDIIRTNDARLMVTKGLNSNVNEYNLEDFKLTAGHYVVHLKRNNKPVSFKTFEIINH
jgi:hypothetical protein